MSEIAPAHHLEMEEAVLGAMLISKRSVEGVLAAALKPSHFYRGRNGVIFSAASALADQDAPVDGLTVADELARRKQLDDVGGRAFVVGLGAQAAAPDTAAHYAEQIIEAANWRNITLAGQRIAAAASDRDPDALAEAEALLARREGQAECEYDSVRQAELIWDMAEKGAGREIPWNFPRLTERCPIAPGSLNVISGPTNCGKSMWVDNLLDLWHIHFDLNVGLMLNEGAVVKRLLRRVGRRTEVDMRNLRRGELIGNERELLVKHLNDETTWHITDITGWSPTMAQRHIQRAGRDVVVIDLLNRFDLDPEHSESSYTQIINALANAASLSQTAVIVLAQLNRDWSKKGGIGPTRRRPNRHDIKGSGHIEQAADTVSFVYRPYDDEGEMEDEGEIYIDKAKDGEPGLVRVNLNRRWMRFDELDPSGHPKQPWQPTAEQVEAAKR